MIITFTCETGYHKVEGKSADLIIIDEGKYNGIKGDDKKK